MRWIAVLVDLLGLDYWRKCVCVCVRVCIGAVSQMCLCDGLAATVASLEKPSLSGSLC